MGAHKGRPNLPTANLAAPPASTSGEPGGFALYDGASGARLSAAAGSPTALIGPGRRLVASLQDGRVVLWGVP